jgi:hypothetical protein
MFVKQAALAAFSHHQQPASLRLTNAHLPTPLAPTRSIHRTIQDRVFDISGNRLVGPFPSFIAQAIPPMEAGCRCACELDGCQAVFHTFFSLPSTQ